MPDDATNGQGKGGVQIFDRQRSEMVNERILGDRFLRLAYWRPTNLLLDRIFLATGWISRLMGWYADTARSRRGVPRVIKQLGIDTSEFSQPLESFQTFNDFFTRHLCPDARPFDADPNVLCSPADCRLTVLPAAGAEAEVPVKQNAMSLPELLLPPDPIIIEQLRGGPVIVCRLAPADYHRFHFPAAGKVLATWQISGRYDSVHPIALRRRPDIFTRNVRNIWLLDLHAFGLCAFVEVGAFGVARIVQTHADQTFVKMQEKGYFAFGGSTIVLCFQPDRLNLMPDIVQHSRNGIECLVRAGESIANSHAGARPA